MLASAASLVAACSSNASSGPAVILVDGPPGAIDRIDFEAGLDGDTRGDWVRRVSSAGDDNVGYAVAVDSDGQAVVGGQTVTTPSGGGSASPQITLKQYTSLAAPGFETFLRSTEVGTVRGVAVDSTGAVVFVGFFEGELDAGDDTLTSQGGEDIVVGKLSDSGGVLWAKSFGGPGDDRALAVAVDRQDAIIVAGSVSESADLGDGDRVGAEQADAFVAKYDEDGELAWARAFGSPTVLDAATAVALGEGDAPHVCGYFGEVFDSGIATHDTRGSSDIFTVRLSFEGQTEYSKTFGGEASDTCLAIVVDDANEATIGGSVRGAVEFDGETTEAGEKPIGYIAHLDTGGNSLFNNAPLGTRQSTFMGLSLNEHGGVDVVGEASEFEAQPERRAVFLQLNDEGREVPPYDVGGAFAPFGTSIVSSSAARAIVAFDDAVFIAGEFTGELRLRGPQLGTNGTDAMLVHILPAEPPGG